MNEKLKKAIAKAEERGKQPFDFKEFAKLYLHDTGSCELYSGDEPEAIQQEYSSMYYIDYPAVMTVKEFARVLNEEDAQS